MYAGVSFLSLQDKVSPFCVILCLLMGSKRLLSAAPAALAAASVAAAALAAATVCCCRGRVKGDSLRDCLFVFSVEVLHSLARMHC